MKNINKLTKRYTLYFFISLILMMISVGIYNNLFYTVDKTFSDKIFQKERAIDRRVVILGIDDETLEYFGPYDTWTRDIYADTVQLLNENEDRKPLAIGMDVLFSGNKDKETDNYFVETCSQYDNIVLGSLAEFEDELVVEESNHFYINDYSIKNYVEPFDKLKRKTKQGFLNSMLDKDGIFRTGILKLDLPDGREVYSFSYKLYKIYAKEHGFLEDLDKKIPMNERYQWYVPFSNGPGNYEEYPLSALFTGELTGEDLEDCIVLIGAYAEGFQDSFITSIDHASKMYGIEIHANMIDAMIEGNFKQEVSKGVQCIFIFFLLAVLVYLFRRCKIWYSLLIWIAVTLGYLFLAKLSYDKGYIIYTIYVPVLATIIFVIEVGVNYVLATIEKHKAVSTFKRYVAPQVVDEIFKAGSENLGLGGKLTNIACLFVDIRGFTTMSELLEPPEVVEILNTYLNLTNQCIVDNGGTLDKFIGDATMAIFNAPLPMDDYIYKAVKTACDMVKGSEKLSEEILKKYGRTVSFGVGVHCGKAVVGNIGTKMRMDYTAIGDTVNTAARLESNAKAGQVLISKAVYDALEGRIEAESLGTSIKLKGKSDEFEIFSVINLL